MAVQSNARINGAATACLRCPLAGICLDGEDVSGKLDKGLRNLLPNASIE
jgi:hypothetical protein